jgi:hypothetical protein
MRPADRRSSPLDVPPPEGSAGAVTTRVLDAPPATWRAVLASDPAATPGHRPELWRHLAATVDGMVLRFVAVEEDGRLLGGGAAFVRRRGGSRWLHVLPYLLSGAPLAVPGAHASVDRRFAAALEAMRRELAVVGGEWAAHRPAGPPPDPGALEAVGGVTRLLETSVIDLEPGIERAWAGLESTARSELQKARASGLVFAEEPEALDEVYVLHLAQARRWSSHRAIPLELARRLLAEPGAPEGPPARLFTVRDRHQLLCAMFYLDQSREILAWWSGSRDDARARHAMTFLYWSTAEWAAAAGRARLNLGGSPGLSGLAAYKRSLGAESVRYPVRWMDAGDSASARAVAALERWARRGRHRGEPE